jgi:Bacterial archaeo-eukaryotic release factor family 11
MLYVDLPTAAELETLAAHRGGPSVSIYLPTTPLTQEAAADRVALKNLAREAARQLREAGADKRLLASLEEQLDDLVDDDAFWRFQARSLAVLATPEHAHTFRLPSALAPTVEASDRFHLKPLLRAVSFPQAAYVLALSENAVRLVEVSADLPAATAKVDGMPSSAAAAVGKASINDRSPSGRIQGSEGKKARLRQFARQVDQALRPLLAGGEVPLLLATAHTLGPIYRSVNSYPHLAAATLEGNPETLSDAELARLARPVLDGLHRERLAAWRELFAAREAQDRATTDVAVAARAATQGAVDSLLVDIDRSVPGTVDEATGAVAFADRPGAGSYGVADEIARRVLAARGRVLAVREDDIPRGQVLAAILRYPV